MDSKRIPEAIQWHEGMLLGPQHLQQLSQRSESLAHYYVHSVSPFFWGIRRLEIDHGLLKTGIFRIVELEAVMPDGLVVSHPAGPGPELELRLQKTTQPITIHLAVPARSAVATRGDLPRYFSADGDSVVDENSGDGEVRIPRLKPQLRLLAGEAVPEKFVSFPLAKYLLRDEAFVLSEFLPPSTVVPQGSVIWEMCSQVVEKIREHALFLAEQVQSPSSANQAAFLQETRNQIQCLVSALPHLEAVLKAEGRGMHSPVHPFEVYKAFCLLAGNLAGLGHALVPPALGPYRHDDLYATFLEITTYAFDVMEEGIPTKFIPHYFQLVDKTFSLVFENEWKDRLLFLAMRGQMGMSDKDVAVWGEKSRIGSRSVMRSMLEKRVLGPARQLIQRYESLVPARGVILFSLEYDPQFIKPGELLQLVNDGGDAGMQPAEVILYVKAPVAEAAAAKLRS